MEQEKINIQPNYKEEFNKLPIGEHMKIPMSLITPITVDDFKSSETVGPLRVLP